MIISIACDHAGFEIKDVIVQHLQEIGHTVQYVGPNGLDILDDFPDYAQKVCQSILTQQSERGVLICGTGVGMSIAANRHKSIRAVLAYSPEIAQISRSHNDANVICFGSRTMNIDTILSSLDIFLNQNFLGGKYQTRNEKLDCTC